MFTDIQLQDYGLILLAFAAFGFIVSDAFKMGRSWGIPIYRNDIEKIFHYISNAISAIIVIFVVILYFVLKYFQSPLIKDFISYIQTVGITETFIEGLFFFTLIYSVLYISAVIAGLYMKVIFHYIKGLMINVYLTGETEPEKFAGLITESKDFFFFQKDDIALWVAIKKDQIVRMETIIDKPKIFEAWNSFHSTIKTFVYPKR
ncbi:MAG: hypothetical protein WCE94_10840 [Candidatus Methanoperedens sp.]